MKRSVFIAIAFTLSSWFSATTFAAGGAGLLKCAAWLTGAPAANAVNSYFSEWMALHDLVDERLNLSGLLDGVQLTESPETIQALVREIQAANGILMTNRTDSAAYRAAVETIIRLEPSLRTAINFQASNPDAYQYPIGKRARSTFRYDDLGSEDDLKY